MKFLDGAFARIWAIFLIAAAAVAGLGTVATLPVPLEAQTQDEFRARLTRAAEISTLAAAGGTPFHLKLSSADTTMHSPAYSAEIEIWWAAPDRWRREIKSAAFTQTAVRDGARLNPIRRTTIFPGVDQLATAAIDPIPFAALAGVAANEDRPECGN
jgi:hypothetical protein